MGNMPLKKQKIYTFVKTLTLLATKHFLNSQFMKQMIINLKKINLVEI